MLHLRLLEVLFVGVKVPERGSFSWCLGLELLLAAWFSVLCGWYIAG